jgi:hypothetical protein
MNSNTVKKIWVKILATANTFTEACSQCQEESFWNVCEHVKIMQSLHYLKLHPLK